MNFQSCTYVEIFDEKVWRQKKVQYKAEQPGEGLGPVVQSIISLISWLRGQLVKCFKTLLPKTMIFFVEKWEKLLQYKSFSHFCNTKYWRRLDINDGNFNAMLTNEMVSFEQQGPVLNPALEPIIVNSYTKYEPSTLNNFYKIIYKKLLY